MNLFVLQMLMPVFTFVSLLLCSYCCFKNYGSIRQINSYVEWPLWGDILPHRVTTLYAVKHSQLSTHFVSFFFFIHFREPAPPFLPPISRSGFVFFRPCPRSPSFFPIFLHFCSQLFVFLHSWFSRMVCSFSLFSSLPSFRLRFTVFHCRDHLFGWYSPLSGTFLSRRIAISVNFG